MDEPPASADAGERSVALLIGDDATGLEIRHTCVPADDVHQVRQRLVALRLAKSSLPVGERVDAVVVIGRPGRRPIVARLHTTVTELEGLWSAIEDLASPRRSGRGN